MTTRPLYQGYQYGDVRLYVRTGEYEVWDRGIVAEVQHVYCWDRLRGRDVRTVIDVGAHIGAYSLYAHHVWPEATIIAVEAESDNARLLRLNVGGIPNMAAYDARVGYRDGDFTLAKARENSGGHIVVERGLQIGADYERVELSGVTYTLEDLMRMHDLVQIDVLKLDCEGSEIDILTRISETCLSSIGCIVGERHHPEVAFMALVGGRLESAGFRLWHFPSSVEALGTFLAMRGET